MIFEQQLRVPGPTPLPARVIRAASRPMINHRGPEFAAVLRDCVEGVRWALQTSNEVLFFPASGSGGLEAVVTNLLSPGEKALLCTIGAFGERWAAMAKAFGVDVVQLQMPLGEAINPDDVERILAEHSDIKKVFVTHNETSTGVTNDIASIARVVKAHNALLAVDSVSGAPSLQLPVDQLGIDVVVVGSQKGWMAPPGLVMIAINAAALEASKSSTCPRWYFDFARQKAAQDKGQTSTTPPVSIMFALQEGLAMMREEGLEVLWNRHSRIASAIRAGLSAMGLRLLAAESHRSDTVTAVHSPASSPDELKAWLTALRITYGLVLAGGQGELMGKIFRIGHLGMIEEHDAYAILASIEQGLVDHGMLSRTGLSVAAAQSVFRAATDPEPVAVG